MMDGQQSIMRNDVNRGLRDRLGAHRLTGTSAQQAAELTLAVNDLHDLARTRFPTQTGNDHRP